LSLEWLQYEQYLHHTILANIRRDAFTNKNHYDKRCMHQEQNYYLPPHRRWFRLVLSPHYLAEILLYLSFAIILEIATTPSAVHDGFSCKNVDGNNKDATDIFHLEIVIKLLSAGIRYRHWMLFLWVATNLTVSAMNSYDWYNLIYRDDNNRKKENTTNDGERHQRTANACDSRRALFPNIL